VSDNCRKVGIAGCANTHVKGMCRPSMTWPFMFISGLFVNNSLYKFHSPKMQVYKTLFMLRVKGARKRVDACSLVEGQADKLGWIKEAC